MSTSTASGTGFGGNAFASATPGSFGSGFGNQQTQNATSTGTGLFGKPAAPSEPTGTGLFGKPATGQTAAAAPFSGSSGIFGSNSATVTDSTGNVGLFGKPAPAGNTASSTNAQPGLFGKNTQGASGGASGGASSGNKVGVYTPLEELTAEEKEQFQANSFTLGKIPTRPPPLELCR